MKSLGEAESGELLLLLLFLPNVRIHSHSHLYLRAVPYTRHDVSIGHKGLMQVKPVPDFTGDK